MKRGLSLLLFFACAGMSVCAQTRYVGGDISLLPQYEQNASYYKDVKGRKINNLLTWFVEECGWNTFRVRLFVNPQQKDAKGDFDPSVCQDLAYVTALGKRIKDAGAYFMLDFHYSDTWVDALNIQAPSAWKDASNAAMADSLGRYTREVLTSLNAAGATPDLVQVGNEIMYGLCGIKVAPYSQSSTDANWPAYIALLKAGCNAVREVCPNAQIIIHSDRPTNKAYDYFYYTKLVQNKVDFDIIGLSYYPFWHAGISITSTTTSADILNNLVTAIRYLASYFPEKKVQIVETAYNFQYWPSSGVSYDTQSVWPCSKKGQYAFVKDLVDALKPLSNVTGINYWFPEEAGNGDYVNWSTNDRLVIQTWLNRGFWDENSSTTGHAINRTGTLTGEQTAADVCAPYYMKNFYNETQDVEEAESQELRAKSRKVWREGQLLIERGGRVYHVSGQLKE